MSNYRYEAWILHKHRQVVVQPAGLGVPAAVVVSSDGTLGGTIFDGSTYIEPDTEPVVISQARTVAHQLGYAVEIFDPAMWDGPDDDEGY